MAGWITCIFSMFACIFLKSNSNSKFWLTTHKSRGAAMMEKAGEDLFNLQGSGEWQPILLPLSPWALFKQKQPKSHKNGQTYRAKPANSKEHPLQWMHIKISKKKLIHKLSTIKREIHFMHVPFLERNCALRKGWRLCLKFPNLPL